MNKPLIGITMGDPAGVGPELCLRVLSKPSVTKHCTPVIFGDANVLRRVAKVCDLKPPRNEVGLKEWLKSDSHPKASVVNCTSIDPKVIKPGQVSKQCGMVAFACIEAAAKAALSKKINAIVTAPINKKSFSLAGIPYPGHTEMLAKLTKAKRYCMMFASDKLIVSLATIHLGYSEVPKLLSKQRILDVIELTAEAVKRLGKKKPKIVVCGLNPHAGEQGMFGNEELKIIEPAVQKARSRKYSIEGPIPPDTAFLPAKLKETDAYIALYHDQGLIPFKMLAFDKGVNVTLGLPIVRTSVDHGTAFDIAWKGTASPNSLTQAILLAKRLSC